MDKNSGYIGFKMSVRAADAYAFCEMPRSKWSKETIIKRMNEVHYNEEIIKIIKKLKSEQAKTLCLVFAGNHHTGKLCNLTAFYSLQSEEELKKINFENFINKKEKTKKEEPTYITALIRREYWDTVRGKYGKKTYKRETEYFIATFRSNERRANGYNLNADNITIIFYKEQKNGFFSVEEFKKLEEVKNKIS